MSGTSARDLAGNSPRLRRTLTIARVFGRAQVVVMLLDRYFP
jgi:hypothetical protein